MTPQNPSPLLTARIQPETEPWGFNFGFLAPKPPPCLVLSDAGPRRRRHLFHTLPPPRPIAPHRHFQRRARNRAVALDFVGFVPNPLPSPCTSNRTGTPQPTPPLHHPTALFHRPLLPFYTARTKPSHDGSVSGFGPNPFPCLALCERTTPPSPSPDTHHLTTSPHHPPLPFLTAHPKSSHVGSVSGFWPKPLPLPHVSRTHNLTTTNT